MRPPGTPPRSNRIGSGRSIVPFQLNQRQPRFLVALPRQRATVIEELHLQRRSDRCFEEVSPRGDPVPPAERCVRVHLHAAVFHGDVTGEGENFELFLDFPLLIFLRLPAPPGDRGALDRADGYKVTAADAVLKTNARTVVITSSPRSKTSTNVRARLTSCGRIGTSFRSRNAPRLRV